MGSWVSPSLQRVLPQIKHAFSTFSTLLGSPWELGQCKSKTAKEEKAEQQAGANAKQGTVFAPRWVAPNRVGGSDTGGLCWKPIPQTTHTGDGKQLPPHGTEPAQLCWRRLTLARLRGCCGRASPTQHYSPGGCPAKCPQDATAIPNSACGAQTHSPTYPRLIPTEGLNADLLSQPLQQKQAAH